MSEFPTQGSPELESLTRFIPQEKLFPIEGEIWDVHAMNNKQRQEKIGLTSREALLKNIQMMIGDPLSIEQFAYQAGVLQGVFLQSQIEYYRRHKYRVGGCLFWDFDDAWPAMGYSIVDYYGRPKPAYYFVKRAFSPVILSFEPGDGGVRAFVINDRHEPVSGYAAISLLRLRNGTVQQQQISFNLSSDSVSEIWAQNWLNDPQNECLIGTIEIDGQVIYQTSYFGALLRDVSFPVPSVSMENDYHHDTLNFHIVSSTFAHAVKLTGLPDNARPDDNYFDLLPKEPRIVTIRNITESEADLVGVLCCEMGSAQLVST
jgi:beta-mannosidase